MKFSTRLTHSLLFALLISGCSPVENKQDYVTVGALLPLTGADSDKGMRVLNGLQLAKREINEKGGILGKKLDIIVLNDHGSERNALQQYMVLKEKDIAAIIVLNHSGVTLTIAKAAETDGIPIVSPSAVDLSFENQNEELTDFDKSYLNHFSQIPLSDSVAAYRCVFALAETINNTEKR